MEDRQLKHWRAIERMAVEQAGLLMAGVDPSDCAGAQRSELAQGMTYAIAMRQASTRAWELEHAVIRELDRYPVDPAMCDIWENTYELHRFLPSIELRRSVASVLADPANVKLMIPVTDPWFSETIYGTEINSWALRNEIESRFVFQNHHAVIIQEKIDTSWAEWRKSQERDDQNGKESATAPSHSGPWPWGAHETKLLQQMAEAAKKFWVNYDPSDSTTAPTNAQVVQWLRAHGVAERNAEVIATILRADGLPSGPRK